MAMRRYGRIVRLREGAEAEYDRMHEHVWPEVMAAIQASGIRNYTIFRHERWLFSYFELPERVSLDKVGEEWTANPACRRWEQAMQRMQEPLPGSAEGIWWVPMKEVWHFSP
jgi:L-rhamnose mutarotase